MTTSIALRTERSISELRALADDFAKSGYFQDARQAAQAVVKIQAGMELGFGPVYSMTKIYLVQGKVAVSAETMGAMIKRSGQYDYRLTEYTNDKVTIVFTDKGKDVFTSSFTMKDATEAGLVKSDGNWKKWPRAMLVSKALSQGARIVCPHVIAGVYTATDMGMAETDSGDLIEGQVVLDKSTGELKSPTDQDFDKLESARKPQPPPVQSEPPKETPPAGPIDLVWLKEQLGLIPWPSGEFTQWLSRTFNMPMQRTVSGMVAALTKEQAEKVVEEINERLEMAGKG